MFAWFKNLLFERNAFELISRYSLEESARILSEQTQRFAIAGLLTTRPVGTVTEKRISLARIHPFVKAGLQPFFIGTFHKEESKVVLRGVFRMHHMGVTFMIVWLLAFGVIAAGAAGPGLRNVGLLFFGGGFLPILLGKAIWRGDVAWISSHLKKALQ